jgi:hypothetical protein
MYCDAAVAESDSENPPLCSSTDTDSLSKRYSARLFRKQKQTFESNLKGHGFEKVKTSFQRALSVNRAFSFKLCARGDKSNIVPPK